MKTVQGLKIAALVPLAFMVLLLLSFGIGETLSGDWSGLMHFVPVIFAVLVAWVCWKRPLWGGVLLLIGVVFEVVFFWGTLVGRPPMWFWPLIIMILPLAFSGLLLLTAEWVQHIKQVPSG